MKAPSLVFSPDHIVYFNDFIHLSLVDKADLIFADPPFGIDFEANMKSYNRTPDSISYVEVPREHYYKFLLDLLKWAYNNSTDHASFWLLQSWTNLHLALQAIYFLQSGGGSPWYELNHIIWKYQFGVFTKKRFTTSHYHLFLLVKNLKKYTFNKPEHYAEDVWYIKRPYQHGVQTAGNELPEELVWKCISTSTNENDLVVDPVIGSGTTMKISLEHNRRCLGIETNHLLRKRIEEKCRVGVRQSKF